MIGRSAFIFKPEGPIRFLSSYTPAANNTYGDDQGHLCDVNSNQMRPYRHREGELCDAR